MQESIKPMALAIPHIFCSNAMCPVPRLCRQTPGLKEYRGGKNLILLGGREKRFPESY